MESEQIGIVEATVLKVIKQYNSVGIEPTEEEITSTINQNGIEAIWKSDGFVVEYEEDNI